MPRYSATSLKPQPPCSHAARDAAQSAGVQPSGSARFLR